MMQAPVEAEPWRGLEELRDVLRAFLSRYCRDGNEIDDVIQETFVRAARYRARLTDRDRLRPWTMRIALNVLVDVRRIQGRTLGGFDSEIGLDSLEGPRPESADEAELEFWIGNVCLGQESALRLLGKVFPSLREDDRLLLASYYGGDRSCRRTALECGVPMPLVKVRLFRARRRLLRRMRRSLSLDGPRPLVTPARSFS